MRTLAVNVLASRHPRAANLLYGKLARRLTTSLGWTADLRSDGSSVWMSVVAEGWQPPRREYEWTMVAAVAGAVDGLEAAP